MSGPILVINPNSNTAVTAGLDGALEPWRRPGGPAIECLTLAEGPFGIESQADAQRCIPPLMALVEGRPDAGAIVIACYSDPGLDVCRTLTAAPVFGIHEAGVLTAMARADRFGVIAVAEGSIPRHRLLLRRMGVLERLAGERAVNLSVDQSARAEAEGPLAEVGAALVADGAQAIVLGCAGMSRHQAALARRLGVPVIDPVRAAVSMALGAVLEAG